MGLIQKASNVLSLKNRAVLSVYFRTSKKISTTPRGKDADIVNVVVDAQKVIHKKKKIRNWMSYGFDLTDQKKDILYLHVTSFGWITLFFWGTIFMVSYYPDVRGLEWARREAYILLRQREVLGLPLVDRNYADPATIFLPPDDELGEDDIVI